MNSYFPAKSVKLIFSGNDFFQTLERHIDSAQEVIHLQTYIFEEDATGQQVLEALISAAKRGVKIFLLLDAYGSKGISTQFINKIQKAAIQFRFFSPIFSGESIYVGRRLHHKIVVIDKVVAIVGGINIGDRYQGGKNVPAWLDYAVLVKGQGCEKLHDLCVAFFEKKRIKKISKVNVLFGNENTSPLVRFSRNDWIKGKNEIYKNVLRAFSHSEKTIVIISSYFLPGYIFRQAIKNARKRGVNVKVILAGKSDLPFLLYAEKHLYDFLIRNGVEIYEWSSSIMHGKAVMVDEKWVTIGSYNFNYLSRYWSIELNAEIKDVDFAAIFSEHTKQITINDCIKIDSHNRLHTSGLFSKIRNGLAYHFYRIIMKIFLPKKHREK